MLPDTDPISSFAYLVRPLRLPMSHPFQTRRLRFIDRFLLYTTILQIMHLVARTSKVCKIYLRW